MEELLLLQNTGLKYDPDMILLIYNLNDIEYKPEVSSGEYEEEDVVPVVEIDPGEDITRFSRNAGLRGFVLKIERRSAFARYMVPRGGSLLRKLGLIDSVEFSWVEKIFQGFSDDNPGWIESRNALTSIAEIADERDIDYVVAIYPLLNELDNYQGKDAHATILQYCRQAGISCVDLLEIFEFANERSYWINYADAHPNAEAHRLVADYLTPIIEERLPE